MAAAIGRLTGKPGVCVATSGPGASNLTTGLATATTEGDPVVAIVGDVPRAMSTKHTHQSMRALEVLAPIAKKTVAVQVEDQAAEVLLDSFRTANAYPKGAVVLSIPQDVAAGTSKILPFSSAAFAPPLLGPGATQQLEATRLALEKAKLPVLLLGMRASAPRVVYAIRAFLARHPIPVVETFQAAGAVSRELVHLFYGRIGLFRNQPGDKLLARSDLVLTVGYDPTEYDAANWNPSGRLNIVHMDYATCTYDFHYQPVHELIGSAVENFRVLTETVKSTADLSNDPFLQSLIQEFNAWKSTNPPPSSKIPGKVHPLHFVRTLQSSLPSSQDPSSTDSQGQHVPTTVITDVGTVYIYMLRYFYAYTPLTFLSSNGQQTLGVGLPWAISASLAQDPPCSRRVVSLSGDGGFMFSSMELVTAVQQGCKITHFVWNDSAYNMVQVQEELKYGRSSGGALGGVDFVKFAESFGAWGVRIGVERVVEGVL